MDQQYNNDERYWDIGLLNKWFAISSILFLITMIWTFIDDNDDEFKEYQREFRKLSIVKAEDKLNIEFDKVSNDRFIYEARVDTADFVIQGIQDTLDALELDALELGGKFYKANMDYLGKKADYEALKYLYENEKLESEHNPVNKYEYKDEYDKIVEEVRVLREIKENIEEKQSRNNNAIAIFKEELTAAQKSLDAHMKSYNLALRNIEKLDRSRMTMSNKVADIVRDLPIIDFLDPYYKVHQIVLDDIKYDVNFAKVQTVDRCISCHLGIDKPGFEDAEQPFTTHPNLDFYLKSSSPHPIDEFGCTGCHAGRARGTSFVSSSHTPSNKEEKKRWEDEYGWKKNHHWLRPMLPSHYSEAGLFKFHNDKPEVKGADKLTLGLKLIDKNGCNGCHLIEKYPQTRKWGPPLDNVNQKVNKEWTRKWIKDPQSFRFNTSMPNFFGQDNNNDPESIRRNNAEIYAITEYLFKDTTEDKNISKKRGKFVGDESNGEKLFNNLGCRGCHTIKDAPSDEYVHSETDYDIYESKHGYEDGEANLYELSTQQGPNLIGLGSKTSAEWVFNWIQNPSEYHPETVMPSLRLSDSEARDITSYLLSFTNKSFEQLEDISYDKDEIDNITLAWLTKSFSYEQSEEKFNAMSDDDKLMYVADKSIRHYGCFGCHTIPGYEDAKPIGAELSTHGSKPLGKFDFAHIHDIEHANYAWFEQKLANPRIFDRGKIVQTEDKLKMPNFYLKPDEIEAIVTALLSFTDDVIEESLIPEDPMLTSQVLDGHKLISQYNCRGCHIIDGSGGQIADVIGAAEFSPPSLNTQGAKVQPDWLFEFLKSPTIIRPNLEVRMPTFDLTDSEWNAIIETFQYYDKNFLSYESDFNVDEQSVHYAAGSKLHDLGACDNCHFYGTEFPKQTAETWAPNLALSKSRLRPEWVVSWLDDPQEIMPGTKMPAPFMPDSSLLTMSDAKQTWGSPLIDLGGDRKQMLRGLRDYIYNIDGQEDISKIIRDYFIKNGYGFRDGGNDDGGDDDWDEWDEW